MSGYRPFVVPEALLPWVARAVSTAVAGSRRDGAVPPPEVAAWLDALTQAARGRVSSDTGSERGRPDAEAQRSPWIGCEQAAHLLGLTPRQVRNLAGEELPGSKVGSVWMFRREDVDDYRRRRKPTGVAAGVRDASG